MHDPATLIVAFDRVAGNRGAKTPGVDGRTVADVEKHVGVPGFLNDLRASLKDGSFRPLPVRERIIPKLGGSGGYEIDPDLAYTDQHDAHLHAAAEHGGVHYVITSDDGFHDFAADNDELLGYGVYTPDDFLMLVYRDALTTVREALLDQIAYYRRLGKPFNLAARLEAAQAPKFATAIREMIQAPAVARALSR